MNIALFTEMERVDGQGRFMMLQARWLSQHGHKVVVFSPQSPVLAGVRGYDVIHVPIGSVRQAAPLQYGELVGDTARLVTACAEHSVDAMIATAKLPFLMARAAFGDRLPIYVPVLSDTYFLPPTPENIAEMQLAASQGRIIGYSFDTIKKHAAAFGFDFRSARYSTFPMDDTVRSPKRRPSEVRDEIGISADEVMVLTICRLDVDKVPAIVPLARAVDTVSQKTGKRVRLVVVGDGTLAEQTRANAPASTLFLGTRHDLADLYHACDIYAGESTTILEAAIAHRPVIMTCAAFHPQLGDKSFGLYGLHSLDYAYTEWSNHAPPTPFDEALLPLVQDSSLRDQMADLAHETVIKRNHVDHTMPWLVDVLSGKPVGNTLFGEDAKVLVSVPGGTADGIDTIAQLCYQRGEDLQIGVAVEEPIPWGRTLAMPHEHVRALALAVRRFQTDKTYRTRFSDGTLETAEVLPEEVRDAIDAAARALPPTSCEPKLALDPPRPMHAVVAAHIDSALNLLNDLPAASDAVAVVWLPDAHQQPDGETYMARLEQAFSGGVILISEPLAWTIVGRLIGAVESYRDDGSPRFTNYKRLAEDLGVTVEEHSSV